MERGVVGGVMRFLRSVAALGLSVAAGGAVILILEAAGPDPVEVVVGTGPGSVVALTTDAVGDAPFTAPFAVDLGLDPALLAAAPRSPAALRSVHHRHSAADQIVSTELANELAASDIDPAALRIARIKNIVERVAGLRVVLSDLEDRDRDRLDDDGHFSVTALDGSAVCVTLGVQRHLTRSLGAAVDVDGVPTSGISWSVYGPCTANDPTLAAELRRATTPGIYGGTTAGDVCDISVLRGALTADPGLAALWGAPLGLAPDAISGYLDGLTPVLLLADTPVTDHGLRGTRVSPRQAILQRGTAVLVDRLGVPAVRCMSGSPLRIGQPVPREVEVVGDRWEGFSLDVVRRIPAGDHAVTSFVLVDVRTGRSVVKPAGIEGILARLAGPIVTPTQG